MSSHTRIEVVLYDAETVLEAHGELCKLFSRNSWTSIHKYIAYSIWLPAGRSNSKLPNNLGFFLIEAMAYFTLRDVLHSHNGTRSVIAGASSLDYAVQNVRSAHMIT